MIHPVTRQTLRQQVLHSLRDYILAHGLKPSDRLPTERELATALGVSRNTLREALKSLEAVGALSRHPKRGTILQPLDFSLLADVSQFQLLHSPNDLRELFIARRLLEVNMLSLVAQSATEEQFERMESAIRLMEAQVNAGGLGAEGDIAFHHALLEATNNKFLAQFGNLLQEFFHDPRTKLLVDEGEARRAIEAHRQILAALRDGDAERAQRLMEKHLDNYIQRGVVTLADHTTGQNQSVPADQSQNRR
ncbi:MAG TPA: FadR/GntR family transcriptional regulator [Chthonomonadales bacterium]|nr:FadR/GntR family transcriptional regulator [Chthonomonadales bacterium]